MNIRAPFSFYGGKSKIAHLYPAPQHDLIVEPFAGSGAYSWLHRRNHATGHPRMVWLNDLDPRTYSMWKFLTSDDAYAIVEEHVPESVEAGVKISEIIPGSYPGLVEICRAEANQGTQGARGIHDQVTAMGARCWKVRRKLLEVIPEVSTWRVTNLPYNDLMNVEATWFIDPPYSGEAGRRYRTDNVNYEELAWWCLNRRGEVIVAENLGADWLPFQPFQHSRVSIRSRYQKANAQEVMFYRSDKSNDCIESSTRMATNLSLIPTEESQ